MSDHILVRRWIYTLIVLLSAYKCIYGALVPGSGELQERTADGEAEHVVAEAPFYYFVSRPDIRAPQWNITTYNQEAVAPGYWFVAPYSILDQTERDEAWVGPHIYDGRGELVWSGAPFFDGFNVFDFRPIEVNGEHMFTAIYKREEAGLIVDNSYQIKQMVTWPGGRANMHEFNVFDEGTKALVFSHEENYMSEEKSREIGYDDGQCWLHGYGLQELDITASPPRTLFNWSMFDHVSFDEFTYPNRPKVDKLCRTGWDSYHCNAIDRFANGDYLISCRHMNAIYKISRESGSIIWRLGGPKSDFKFGPDAEFSRQHHARILEQNETHTLITLFDNARSGIKATHGFSRGLVLSLHDNVAKVVAEYPRPDLGYSTSRGSLEVLPNGNMFICWAFHSRLAEYSADGELLMKAKLPEKKNTYRAYKSPWIGRPLDPPDVWSRAVEIGSPPKFRTDIYVSWNGATEVAKWNVYSTDPQGVKSILIRSIPKTGFETHVEVNEWIHNVTVEAIDSRGEILGQSKVVQSIPPGENSKAFQEKQEWLEQHVPSTVNGNDQQAQDHTYQEPSDAQTQDESSPSNAGNWDITRLLRQKQTLLAFLAGFLISILAFAVCWTGCCLRSRARRKQSNYEYMEVNKDEHDDELELDEGFEQVESDRSRGKGLDDNIDD